MNFWFGFYCGFAAIMAIGAVVTYKSGQWRDLDGFPKWVIVVGAIAITIFWPIIFFGWIGDKTFRKPREKSSASNEQKF